EVKDLSLLSQLSQGCLAFSADGKTLAIADLKDTLHLYDTTTRALLTRVVWKEQHIHRVAFSTDGERVATVSEQAGAGIALWNTATGALERLLKVPDARLEAISFSPDDKALVSGTKDGTIQSWDLATGKPHHTFQDNHREKPLCFWVLECSPDGRHVAIGDV